MLAGIRRDGRRAIVYDTAGTFVEKFYRPGIDVLLNPLDARSDCWSPWVDVPRDYHYDQIAESTIPDKSGDPFWARAARGTLVAVLRKLARQERTLVSVLLDTLLRSKLKDLAAFAQGHRRGRVHQPRGRPDLGRNPGRARLGDAQFFLSGRYARRLLDPRLGCQ